MQTSGRALGGLQRTSGRDWGVLQRTSDRAWGRPAEKEEEGLRKQRGQGHLYRTQSTEPTEWYSWGLAEIREHVRV